jgi:hypothetical protein
LKRPLIRDGDLVFECSVDTPRARTRQGALLDKLIHCYNGSEDILLMITTFMQNYKAVPGFDGYPNIGALWGWKDTLMKMALEGSKRKQGQAQMVDKEGADVFG